MTNVRSNSPRNLTGQGDSFTASFLEEERKIRVDNQDLGRWNKLSENDTKKEVADLLFDWYGMERNPGRLKSSSGG